MGSRYEVAGCTSVRAGGGQPIRRGEPTAAPRLDGSCGRFGARIPRMGQRKRAYIIGKSRQLDVLADLDGFCAIRQAAIHSVRVPCLHNYRSEERRVGKEGGLV